MAAVHSGHYPPRPNRKKKKEEEAIPSPSRHSKTFCENETLHGQWGQKKKKACQQQNIGHNRAKRPFHAWRLPFTEADKETPTH